MSNGRKEILGPGGLPISTEPSIVVIKSREPLPPQLIQSIGVVTRASVVVLPFGLDLLSGKLAKEEIEAVHKAIHDILGIKEPETP